MSDKQEKVDGRGMFRDDKNIRVFGGVRVCVQVSVFRMLNSSDRDRRKIRQDLQCHTRSLDFLLELVESYLRVLNRGVVWSNWHFRKIYVQKDPLLVMGLFLKFCVYLNIFP